MKISIRSGVFETNSSSVHALAMQKDFNLKCIDCKEKYKDVIPSHISFKLDSQSCETYDYYKKCSVTEIIVNKILFIYANILSRMSSSREYSYTEPAEYGYIDLTKFFGFLNALGITYDIQFQEDFFLKDEGCPWDPFFYSNCDNVLWEHIYDGTEETFCNFLFGDGSCMDGYDDDCLPQKWEEFIDNFWKKMKNYGKCETYHYRG